MLTRSLSPASFTHNPHIALPTTLDLLPRGALPLPTFPHPLPPYLPRSVHVPPARPPPSFSHNAIAGLFTLSLTGARRALRARPSSPYLVKAIESHLVAWLHGGTYLNPDDTTPPLRFPGQPVGGRDHIREVARDAARLVWAVQADNSTALAEQDGAFARYVVHCVARWYGVVSFSKDTDSHRLTYLLRPNVTRPDPRINALDTPPATDASVSDASGMSDASPTDASDLDASESDLDAAPPLLLFDIDESRPCSPDVATASSDDSDERGFAASVESLSLSTHELDDDDEPTRTPSRLQDATPRADVDESVTPSRARIRRDRLSGLYPRSASSPSPVRRPARLFPRKLAARRKRKAKSDNKGFAGAVGTHKGTFYDYLFA